jgi:hypothetical protein
MLANLSMNPSAMLANLSMTPSAMLANLSATPSTSWTRPEGIGDET